MHSSSGRAKLDRERKSSLGPSLLIAANLFGAPGAIEPSPGFTFCVTPHPPDCIDAPAKSDPAEDCERRVRAYTARVFRYRECLEAEIERHVGRANEVLDKLKCKQTKECR